ncbi:MAG: hypothetical protein JF612_02420 [Planctomycetia bacterium]|jgi:hypothetical protein|nr:hypothetical protein [Planctomycetia bacterium]
MRRFRFTIRDLLWFMVVLGLAEAWWFDHRRIEHEAQQWRILRGRWETEFGELRRREELVRAREGEVVGDKKGDAREAVGDLP